MLTPSIVPDPPLSVGATCLGTELLCPSSAFLSLGHPALRQDTAPRLSLSPGRQPGTAPPAACLPQQPQQGCRGRQGNRHRQRQHPSPGKRQRPRRMLPVRPVQPQTRAAPPTPAHPDRLPGNPRCRHCRLGSFHIPLPPQGAAAWGHGWRQERRSREGRKWEGRCRHGRGKVPAVP